MRVRKAGSVVGLLGAAAVLVVSGLSVVMANPFLDTSACTIPQDAVRAPYWAIYISAGVGAFVLGSLLSRWRDFSKELTEHDPPGERHLAAASKEADRRTRRRARTVQLVLAVSLTLITALLAYETWALLESPPRSPLTDFVRCASGAAFPQTLLASVALLFLAGHWLWHPVRRYR